MPNTKGTRSGSGPSVSQGGKSRAQGRGKNVKRARSASSDDELRMETQTSDSVVVVNKKPKLKNAADKLVAEEADKKSNASSSHSPAGSSHSAYSNDPEKKEKLRKSFEKFNVEKQGLTKNETTNDEDEDKNQEFNLDLCFDLRIRKDIFEESDDDTLREQVTKMNECVGNLCNELQLSLKNLNKAGSTGELKDYLNCFHQFKQTLFGSYFKVDELDMELRSDDVLRFQVFRQDPDYEKYETITLEEMAEYFLKLLALGFFLREEASAPWHSNLLAFHLRISRILNFYMVWRNTLKTQNCVVNLLQYISPKTLRFLIPIDILVGLTDHIKRYHDRALVDDSTVIYEHCTLGFKGFSKSIDAIMRKVRESRYKAHGMTAPIRDSEGSNFSFENDMEILWEIRDRVFENPAEPFKGMSAEAMAAIRDYKIPKPKQSAPFGHLPVPTTNTVPH